MFILNPTPEGNRTPWVVNPAPRLNATAKIHRIDIEDIKENLFQ